MRIAVFGVPTAVTSFGIRIVQALVSVALGPFDLVLAGSVADVEAEWSKRQHQHVIIFHETPDGVLAHAVTQSGIPTIVFMQDPVQVAKALQGERGSEFTDALRTTTLCLAVLEEIARGYTTVVIDCSRYDYHLDTLVRFFAQVLGIHLEDQQVYAVLSNFIPDWSPEQRYSLLAECHRALAAPAKDVVDTAAEAQLREECLSAYRPIVSAQLMTGATWPVKAMLNMDRKGAPLAGPVEFAGIPRILIYGPYFGLPRGNWRAIVDFSISDNPSGCDIEISAVSNGFLATGRSSLPSSGAFRTTLDFEIHEPRWPAELHFTLKAAAIEGAIKLKAINLVRRLGSGGGSDAI